MCECQVHEAVFVEVERDDAHGRRREGGVPRFGLPKRSFARICQHDGGAPPSSEDQIDSSIIVQI